MKGVWKLWCIVLFFWKAKHCQDKTEPFQVGDEIYFNDIINKDVFVGNKHEV